MTELIPPSAPMSPIKSGPSSAAAFGTHHVRRHGPEARVLCLCCLARPLNHPLRGDDPTTREPHTERAIPSLEVQHESRTTSGP